MKKKARERIFIVPNWFGFMYGAGIIAALLTASTYSNNLIYSLSFFIVGLFLIGMVQANANVKGVEIEKMDFMPKEEGKPGKASIWIRNTTNSDKFFLVLRIGELGKDFYVIVDDLEAGGSSRVDFEVPPQGLGVHKIEKIRIASTFPLGTFYSWKPFKISKKIYVYPKAEGEKSLPHSKQQGEAKKNFGGVGGEDFTEHKNYEKGEPLQHIDWKAYAKRGQLLTKVFDDGENKSISIALEPNIQSLRQASFWIELCESQKMNYRLTQKEKSILRWGSGKVQARKAREILAQEAVHVDG